MTSFSETGARYRALDGLGRGRRFRTASHACGAIAALAAALLSVRCAPRVETTVARPAPAASQTKIVVPEDPVVRSVRGVAYASLTAVLGYTTLIPTFAYRGRTGPGPTFRVRPGDRIVVDYTNGLPADDYAGNMTDLHFHGLITSPLQPGDDVMDTMIYPNQHYRYEVLVGKTQEPGLYWYHPHPHGDTNRQVGLGGMSGAIVVEGIARDRPELAALPERVLVLRDVADDLRHNAMRDHPLDVPVDRDGGGTNVPCAKIFGHHLELNGTVDPRIPVADGGAQFFRFLNATGARTLDLSIPGTTLRIVALDGVALDAYPKSPPSEDVDHVVVPPGARVEFTATGLRAGMSLQSACYDSGPDGDGDPAATLATFAAGVDARPHLLGERDRDVAVEPGALRRTMPLPAAHRTIVLSETNLNGDSRFAVDGRGYRMGDPPLFTAKSGTVEAWTVVNKSREMHDFHIHQVHFVVTATGGHAVSGPRFWHDSFPVPPAAVAPDGRLIPSETEMLVDFRDPVVRGVFMLHCHLLDHEDAGMMASIAVR